MSSGAERVGKEPPRSREPIMDVDGGNGMQRVRTRHAASRLVREAAAAFLVGDPHYALHGHEIDDHAKAVLDRIGESGRTSDRVTAAEAIVAALPRESWAALFADCIVAEWRARSHQAWVSHAQVVMDRHPEAQKP
jgi:hypothetical protein